MKKIKIGLALGSGGGRGSYHAGIAKWLDEHKDTFEIVSVAGSSVGALNGAFIASGNINKLIDIWLSVSKTNSYYPNYRPFGKIQGLLFNKSLYSNEWFRSTLKANIDFDSFIENGITFGAIYVDINSSTRETKIITNTKEYKDYLIDGIIASASLFPAYPPVSFGTMLGIDGGFRNPIPVKEVIDISVKPLDKILILPCVPFTNFPSIKNISMVNILTHIIDMSADNAALLSMQNGKNKSKYILIEPHINICGTLELEPKKHVQNIQHGYDRASEVLKGYIKYKLK